MARLRRSSWGWGAAGAADPVEVGRLHGEGFEPIGQAAGGADHAFGGEGAQLLEQLVFELPPAAAQQGPVAQVKAKAPVPLANQW